MDSWLETLLDECKQILTEYGFTSRWTRIEGYHALGARVVAENANFERKAIYGQGIVKKVSESLGMSERQLQYAIQFYQKFPDLNMLPAGKNISWSKIIKEYLPNEKKPQVEQKICPTCGQKVKT